MFKLVVLSALVALAVAKPSLGYSAVLHAAPVAIAPAAVSHAYRKDIISEPVVALHAAPAVGAAPVIARTVVAAPIAVPAAVSHTYRSDVVSRPVVAVHAAPALAYAAHVPAVHAW